MSDYGNPTAANSTDDEVFGFVDEMPAEERETSLPKEKRFPVNHYRYAMSALTRHIEAECLEEDTPLQYEFPAEITSFRRDKTHRFGDCYVIMLQSEELQEEMPKGLEMLIKMSDLHDARTRKYRLGDLLAVLGAGFGSPVAPSSESMGEALKVVQGKLQDGPIPVKVSADRYPRKEPKAIRDGKTGKTQVFDCATSVSFLPVSDAS